MEESRRKEREKFESLPEWKQQLLKKKKSVSEIDTNSDTKSEVRIITILEPTLLPSLSSVFR